MDVLALNPNDSHSLAYGLFTFIDLNLAKMGLNKAQLGAFADNIHAWTIVCRLHDPTQMREFMIKLKGIFEDGPWQFCTSGGSKIDYNLLFDARRVIVEDPVVHKKTIKLFLASGKAKAAFFAEKASSTTTSPAKKSESYFEK